jgi:hypothetical protein
MPERQRSARAFFLQPWLGLQRDHFLQGSDERAGDGSVCSFERCDEAVATRGESFDEMWHIRRVAQRGP